VEYGENYKNKGIAHMRYGSSVDTNPRLWNCICKESESVAGVANVNILFHNLGSFIVDVVRLTSTICQDAKFVFLLNYSHMLDQCERVLVVNVPVTQGSC